MERQRAWFQDEYWSQFPETLPTHIYFDMDDTLTRTSDYFYNETIKRLADRGDMVGAMEFQKLVADKVPRFNHPTKFVNVNKEIVKVGDYMLDVKPTPLFNFFFLIPGNQPKGVNFGIVTHRGDSKKAKRYTESWLSKQQSYATIKDIHCIHPSNHRSKLDYLLTIHPAGDFLLIDDNPLFDVSVVHPHHRQLRIHTQHCTYGDAYKNQKQVEFRNGMFLL